MNFFPTILLILLFSSHILPHHVFDSEPLIRVRIINTLQKLQISFYGEWVIKRSGDEMQVTSGRDRLEFFTENHTIKIRQGDHTVNTEEKHIDFICSSEDGTIKINDVPYGVGWWWEGQEDRIYEGFISLYINDSGTFDVIVQLPLEKYLMGVVPYEMGSDSPLEALKAQAVAARSEAVIALTSKLYSGEHHDLTSDVECQVFSGNHKRTFLTDRAVEDTKSLVLSELGEPINAYYASNCGGHSELIKNVWPDRPDPYSYNFAGRDSQKRINLNLQDEKDIRRWIFSRPQVFCNPDREVALPSWSRNNFRWKKVFAVRTLSEMIAADSSWGNLLDIKVLQRGVSGRIILARFIFEHDSLQVKGELAIRQLWKPALRSSCLVIDKESDKFVLNGAGWGHGVGMCQSGAIAQSKLGEGFRAILRHYYQRAEIIKIY